MNYRYLDTPQKLQRMKSMYATIVKQKGQIKLLEDKLSQQFHANCVAVDSELNNGLAKLLNVYEKDAITEA